MHKNIVLSLHNCLKKTKNILTVLQNKVSPVTMSMQVDSYMRAIGRGRGGYNVLHEAAGAAEREVRNSSWGSSLELRWM